MNAFSTDNQFNSILTDIHGNPIDINKPHNAIVAASLLTRQPETVPYRVVLRLVGMNATDSQWIVHTELFLDYTIQENGVVLGQPSYEQGDYYQFVDMVEAYNRWVERSKGPSSHIGSIFRASHLAEANELNELLKGANAQEARSRFQEYRKRGGKVEPK